MRVTTRDRAPVHVRARGLYFSLCFVRSNFRSDFCSNFCSCQFVDAHRITGSRARLVAYQR